LGEYVSVFEEAMGVLEPLVGRPMATICLHTTAVCVGKSSENLTAEDLVTIEAQMRALLSAAAPIDAVDAAISALRTRCS
jgi:hypothetical protein